MLSEASVLELVNAVINLITVAMLSRAIFKLRLVLVQLDQVAKRREDE